MVRAPDREHDIIRLKTWLSTLETVSQCLSDETLKTVGPFYLVSMPGEIKDPTQGVFMYNLSWTPHSSLEKDNSLNPTPVLAQRWAVWSILTKN